MADEDRTTAARSQRVHELGLKLAILLVVAVGAFVGTRAVAIEVHDHARSDAAYLHQLGTRELQSGQLDGAVSSFRRASSKDRSNTGYSLSYAEALRAQGQIPGAERVLLLLRAQEPEHPQVNLELARLAAARDDVEMAVRYYRYALYAPWDSSDGPRQVREELVTFLLNHRDRNRAVSELMAARSTTPDDAAAHLRLGRRFVEAGEHRLALEEFRRAIQLAPSNADARQAAGDSAYETGDYRLAASMLADAGLLDAESTRRLEVARAVLSLDPLAPRLDPATRVVRTTRLGQVAMMAAAACSSSTPHAAPPQRLDSILRAVHRSAGRDLAAIADAVDAASMQVSSLPHECQPSDPAAQALLVLGERLKAASP